MVALLLPVIAGIVAFSVDIGLITLLFAIALMMPNFTNATMSSRLIPRTSLSASTLNESRNAVVTASAPARATRS